MKYKTLSIIVIQLCSILFSLKCFAVTFNNESPVYYHVNHQTELQLIKDQLEKTHTVGVTGVVGIGKSEIIRKYVEQYQYQYEIIAIFNASINLNSQYLDLIHEINHNICLKEGCNISENPKYAKENLLNYLTHKENWLLIFDNLHVTENKKIKDIIDWEHKGNIIICSQEGNYLDYQVKMTYLDKKSSDLLITKIMKNPPKHYISALTKLLQGYPHMLATSAIYLEHHPHVTIDDYVNHMIDRDNKVKAHIELCLKTMSPNAKELLYNIAMLDNQRISREMLTELFSDKEHFIYALDELINYGLVDQINKKPEIQEFRMHDAIRNEVVNLMPNCADTLNLLLDKLNKYLPLNQTVPVRYALISKPTVLTNIEALAKNADKYHADIYKLIRVNDILLDHYLKTRDWASCAEKSNWLAGKEKLISLKKMTNEQKVTYGHYLTNIGVYYDFALSKFITSIKYYDTAKKILNETTGYYIIYNTAYFQQALTQVGIGDLANARNNFVVIENKLQENKVPLNADRVLGGKAKLSLAEGNYHKALEEINILAEAESHLSKQTVATPIYLIKAEILNYMGKFQEAHSICDELYKQEEKNFNSMHEVLARILVQLARSELGLGKQELAMEHITKSILFFENEYLELKQKHPINDKFASALTTRGEILSSQGDFNNAIRDYKKARKIYFSRYRDNDKNMDNVSYNLFKLAEAAYQNKDHKLYKHVRDELLQKFGINHFRSQQIISIFEMKPKL